MIFLRLSVKILDIYSANVVMTTGTSILLPLTYIDVDMGHSNGGKMMKGFCKGEMLPPKMDHEG